MTVSHWRCPHIPSAPLGSHLTSGGNYRWWLATFSTWVSLPETTLWTYLFLEHSMTCNPGMSAGDLMSSGVTLNLGGKRIGGKYSSFLALWWGNRVVCSTQLLRGVYCTDNLHSSFLFVGFLSFLYCSLLLHHAAWNCLHPNPCHEF